VIDGLNNLLDRFLGRGSAAISVPPFDGALKPNQILDRAEEVVELEAPEDLATDGTSVFIADGPRVLQYLRSSLAEHARVDGPITALAWIPGGGLAAAIDGREVRILTGPHKGRSWDAAGGEPFHAVNAIAATDDGRLLVTDGSRTQPYPRWCHDLMELGSTGRCVEIELDGGVREIARGLAYAFGACRADGDVWVSESWAHRVRRFASRDGAAAKNGSAGAESALDRLPGYPARIVPAKGGGYWLTVFAARTQLVEFVLREHAFRKRMMREIDPEHWVAPALRWGRTYLEPMQGAHIKTMGIVKPWAPPRAYGLVIRLNPDGLLRYSFHSRVDGSNHGIVAAAECDGWLYLLAKGPRRLVRVSVAEAERSLQA